MQKKIIRQANEQLEALDEQLTGNVIFDKLFDATKQRRSHLAVAMLAATAFLVIVMSGSGAFANLVGFVYPMYATFKAIKTKTTQDDTKWLTYWLVFGTFSTIESLSDLLLNWVPLYFVVKSVFFLWCYLPTTNGATLIFDKAIDPVMSKIVPHIDGAAADAKAAATGKVE